MRFELKEFYASLERQAEEKLRNEKKKRESEELRMKVEEAKKREAELHTLLLEVRGAHLRNRAISNQNLVSDYFKFSCIKFI